MFISGGLLMTLMLKRFNSVFLQSSNEERVDGNTFSTFLLDG